MNSGCLQQPQAWLQQLCKNSLFLPFPWRWGRGAEAPPSKQAYPPVAEQKPHREDAFCSWNMGKTSEFARMNKVKSKEGRATNRFLVTHVGDFRAQVQRNKLNYGGGSSAICNTGLFEILLEEN